MDTSFHSAVMEMLWNWTAGVPAAHNSVNALHVSEPHIVSGENDEF